MMRHAGLFLLLAVISIYQLSVSATSSLNCTFEQSCHFIQDKTTDNLDWNLNSGRTGSTHTGPEYDHTLQTGAGHYIFLETSSRHHGDRARLESPSFTAHRGQCLSFYYNMYGDTIGALNVYLNHIDPTTKNVTFTSQLWTRLGQQSQDGKTWLHALVSLDSGHNSTVSFSFEAVVGNGFHGDIALDDISVVDSCTVDPPTSSQPTTSPGPLTSEIPSLTVTSDVHVKANPSIMHEDFTKHLTVNCSYTHGNGSDFSTLVSLLLSKKNSSQDKDFTELATITAFSNDQLTVKNDIGARVSGHLVATGQSFITFDWLYPSNLVLGEYKCEGFGVDHAGHPRDSSSTTIITQLPLDCKTVLPKYKETDLKLDALNTKLNNLVNTLLETSTSFNNHTYSLSRPVAMDVEMGKDLCGASGGYLVEINDKSEFEFLVNFTESGLQDNKTSAIVLGSTNEGHPSEWRFLSSAEVMTYFNWNDGPSNDDAGNCLYVGQQLKMFNDQCKGSSLVRLVCEINN